MRIRHLVVVSTPGLESLRPHDLTLGWNLNRQFRVFHVLGARHREGRRDGLLLRVLVFTVRHGPTKGLLGAFVPGKLHRQPGVLHLGVSRLNLLDGCLHLLNVTGWQMLGNALR